MIIKPTIKLYLNLTKRKLNGEIPIYARIIFNREKFELSTKQFVKKQELWDEMTQRVQLRSPVNSALSDLEDQIQEAFNTLKYTNRPINIHSLREQLNNDSPLNIKLSEYMEEYFQKYAKYPYI